jgi:opine dehydrogenase
MTTSLPEAIAGADVVMLAVPSVAHETYAQALAPLLTPDLPVFLNPGHTGGGLHFVHELRKAGYEQDVRTCETVTLTYICRKEEPDTVAIYSYTKQLASSAFPGKYADDLFELLRTLYPEVQKASSVLETGLTNLNAVFHPPGMLMNAGWIESTGGDFLFYHEGITPAVGRVVASVDAERLAVADALHVPRRTFLESFHAAGLTTEGALRSGDVSRACRESAPNRTIKSPGSLDHRYVHEDVGYGLVPMAAFGCLAGVPTPTIDAIVHLTSIAVDIDYAATGLTLKKMGLEGRRAEEIEHFLYEGR